MSDKLTGEALEQALKDRDLPSDGTADEKRAAVEKFDAETAKSNDTTTDAAEKGEGTTTLDSHLDAPSVTAPGDGPADTTDPTERASSATPDKGAAAQNGDLTVNAVVKVGNAPKQARKSASKERIETYKATKPNGDVVTITHNLDTGATSVD